ncbi:Zinc finger protein [Plakobranchus ocellatus]|uniref:Zinc finger protein n=1 Tax=Plakobranchus ocellatus TaxID=259542 RepID=A0AAV3YVW8_9GAST|nr:Zinc finger protein [Plakobranchus ocellatus]
MKTFGMMNSGASPTRTVKMLVRGMNHVVDYVEDLLVHTMTWKNHMRTLRELFSRLQQANFIVRPTKCVLKARTIDFAGHRLGEGAFSLQDEKWRKFGLHHDGRPRRRSMHCYD